VGGNGGRRIGLLAAVLLALGLLTSAGSAGNPRTPGVRALFFGDSLIAGSGAVPRRPVEVRTAADRLGWQPVVDAVGGTGYTTGGRHGRPYLDRLRRDHALDTQYDVVVLEGGTNDADHGSLTRLRTAALATVDLVRRKQPRARIVLVGAFAPAGVALDRYAQADRILAGVAHDRGLRYVSQLAYSTVADQGFLSKDHYHPSDAGYAVMGKDLAAALRG
jgi:lysophospholipase L1-like esterase